jgi:hypothetical protein
MPGGSFSNELNLGFPLGTMRGGFPLGTMRGSCTYIQLKQLPSSQLQTGDDQLCHQGVTLPPSTLSPY